MQQLAGDWIAAEKARAGETREKFWKGEKKSVQQRLRLPLHLPRSFEFVTFFLSLAKVRGRTVSRLDIKNSRKNFSCVKIWKMTTKGLQILWTVASLLSRERMHPARRDTNPKSSVAHRVTR